MTRISIFKHTKTQYVVNRYFQSLLPGGLRWRVPLFLRYYLFVIFLRPLRPKAQMFQLQSRTSVTYGCLCLVAWHHLRHASSVPHSASLQLISDSLCKYKIGICDSTSSFSGIFCVLHPYWHHVGISKPTTPHAPLALLTPFLNSVLCCGDKCTKGTPARIAATVSRTSAGPDKPPVTLMIKTRTRVQAVDIYIEASW